MYTSPPKGRRNSNFQNQHLKPPLPGDQFSLLNAKYAKKMLPGPIVAERDQPFMDKRTNNLSEGFLQSRIDSRF